MARYLTHAKGLASRRIGEEEVIVSPRAGRVWSLNPAGALVWELADGSQDHGELAAALAAARGLEPEAAAAEVEKFASVMSEAGLMEWRDLPGERTTRSQRAEKAPTGRLLDAPALLHQEQLQVLTGACDSNHSGQGAACMTLGSCASVFN